MPTDLQLPFAFDGNGDVKTVTGRDNVIQQIAMTTLHETTAQRGRPITKTELEDYRGDLEDALRDHRYVDTLVRIEFTSVTDEELAVTVVTRTDEISFSLNQ